MPKNPASPSAPRRGSRASAGPRAGKLEAAGSRAGSRASAGPRAGKLEAAGSRAGARGKFDAAGLRQRVGDGLTLTALFAAIVGGLFLLLLFMEVIPLRSYQTQRREMASAQARLEMLRTRNGQLEERVRLLKTDAELQRVAREQFGMVKPGESLLLVPNARIATEGLPTRSSIEAVAPPPSATSSEKPSKAQAILDTILFWR